MKMKVKDFLQSPWLPVWTAILMMANVVAVDVLHLAWPITVAGPDLRCPAGLGVAVLLPVAAVAVVMLVVELRKRRWLRVGMRLLLVLAGCGILMAGSWLWWTYCEGLNHTMMIEVESVNENLLDVDGYTMNEELFVDFLRKLKRCNSKFHMRVGISLYGYDGENYFVVLYVHKAYVRLLTAFYGDYPNYAEKRQKEYDEWKKKVNRDFTPDELIRDIMARAAAEE